MPWSQHRNFALTCGFTANTNLMEFGMDPFRAPLRPLAVIALIALFFVPACETIEGAGRDLSAAGQAVTQEAQAAQ